MSIHWDCYPKRLRSIAIRNLPSYPSNLMLIIKNLNNETVLQKSHIFTSNPTWRLLDIPGANFPLVVEVLNEENELLYSLKVSSEDMYFICEQLEDLEPFTFTAILMEFDHEAYYTTVEYSDELTKLASKCDKLLKYQVTSMVKARELYYEEAHEKYMGLYYKRKQLSDISAQILTIKNELMGLFPSKKYHYLNYKKCNELQKESEKYMEIIENQKKMIEKYKKLIADKIGQKKVYDELLKAHRKKKSERMEKGKKDREKVIFKERLLKSRRIKMMRELWEALKSNEIFKFRDTNKRASMTQEGEEEVNFSNGYLAHAMDILNDIFQTPSIYSVKFQGSRSSIFYQGRELPLFIKPDTPNIGAEIVRTDCEKYISKTENDKYLGN
ncbi:hypothetical protein SteCoe_36174 [Stentor coeruleus]|uniref:Uncharacterized protein n=1 Tax=Stentor coeruleus TaxID=5963 RepID=A0A1R2AQP7_9CILI|nr:hypothetical protein SteCoe_36174 [Stentor coeruleus]